MPLPTDANLETLDIANFGQPFVQVEAKSLSTTTLDVAYYGQPFVAVGPASTGGDGLNVWVKVGGVWTAATGIWVKAGGVWKVGTDVLVKDTGTWKT